MFKYLLSLSGLILCTQTQAQSSCDEAFSAASYSIAHTENAYEATNMEHVQEWSEKALETFSEVESITIDCDCNEAADYAYKGYSAAEKCLDQSTWEEARYYSKKAMQNARQMMSALSLCSNMSVDEILTFKGRNRNTSPRANTNYNTYKKEEPSNTNNNYSTYGQRQIQNNEIEQQKQELLEKQKTLLEEQRRIQQQLAQQKLLEEKLRRERETELLRQKKVKINAETAINNIKKNYEKLLHSIGCDVNLNELRVNFYREIEDINSENLEDTKTFYVDRVNEIAEKFALKFADCLSKQ